MSRNAWPKHQSGLNRAAYGVPTHRTQSGTNTNTRVLEIAFEKSDERRDDSFSLYRETNAIRRKTKSGISKKLAGVFPEGIRDLCAM